MIDFDKLPATLQGLVKLCCQTPNNAAHVGVLTDYLKDAPPEECHAALSFLAEQSYKLTALNAKLAKKPNERRFTRSQHIPKLDLRASLDHPAMALRYLREDIGQDLMNALEEGHWYAVRLTRTQREYWPRQTLEIRLTAAVQSMDGGQIRET